MIRRLRIDKFLEEQEKKNEKEKGEEEIGLFTFYRREQEREDDGCLASKTKKHSPRKLRHKVKGADKRIMAQMAKRSLQGTVPNEHLQLFLKNVALKSFKNKFPKMIEANGVSVQLKQKEKTWSSEIKVEQSDFNVSRDEVGESECEVVEQSREYEKKLVKGLKRFEEILQQRKQVQGIQAVKVCQGGNSKQMIKKAASQKVGNRLTFKVRAQEDDVRATKVQSYIREQVIQQGEEQCAGGKTKSLQQSFLQKLRTRQRGSPARRKKMRHATTNQNLHQQNQKYISNLIQNFQLPSNVHNQAAKMLRETLRFPDLLFTRSHLRTKSISPTRFMYRFKSDVDSFSCRKNSTQMSKVDVVGSVISPLELGVKQRPKVQLKKQRLIFKYGPKQRLFHNMTRCVAK